MSETRVGRPLDDEVARYLVLCRRRDDLAARCDAADPHDAIGARTRAAEVDCLGVELHRLRDRLVMAFGDDFTWRIASAWLTAGGGGRE